VSKDLVNTPTARSWRDIPQPVKTRAMSRGGRWRLVLAGVRVAGGVVTVLGLGWGGWKMVGALGENPKTMPAVARAVPVKSLDLETDGVATSEWLARTLAIPRHASLMELDLAMLRDRLLADGQVVSANLTRRFPDTLVVQVRERTPVVRVMAEVAGERQPLLIARDGVVFRGAGFDAAVLDSLPWLDGVAIARKGARFLPIGGMDVVAGLLAKARLEAEPLYRTWGVVSLARLESDREIEVRTRDPYHLTIIFAANPAEDQLPRDLRFLQQIAKLDLLWETFANHPEAVARIDLSLGRQVPVMIDDPAPARDRTSATSARSGTALISFVPPAQPRTQREL
jgi:hypothetical protein